MARDRQVHIQFKGDGEGCLLHLTVAHDPADFGQSREVVIPTQVRSGFFDAPPNQRTLSTMKAEITGGMHRSYVGTQKAADRVRNPCEAVQVAE